MTTPPYINLGRIIPPNPNDSTVNVATQLNANWDEIERVLTVQQGNSPVVSPEYGLEVIDYTNSKLQMWTGAAFKTVTDFSQDWTTWQAFALQSPIVARSGFTPRWRSNPTIRLVEIQGRVQNGSTPASFGASTVQLTNNTGTGIPATFNPVGNNVIYSNAATPAISPSTASGSYISVQSNGANNVKILGTFLGSSDGTSSLVLDNIAWWY